MSLKILTLSDYDIILKIARMHHKFVSNSDKESVFTNILFPQVLTIRNIMILNKREPIGPVIHERQNENTGAESFSMNVFMLQNVR